MELVVYVAISLHNHIPLAAGLTFKSCAEAVQKFNPDLEATDYAVYSLNVSLTGETIQ